MKGGRGRKKGKEERREKKGRKDIGFFRMIK